MCGLKDLARLHMMWFENVQAPFGMVDAINQLNRCTSGKVCFREVQYIVPFDHKALLRVILFTIFHHIRKIFYHITTWRFSFTIRKGTREDFHIPPKLSFKFTFIDLQFGISFLPFSQFTPSLRFHSLPIHGLSVKWCKLTMHCYFTFGLSLGYWVKMGFNMRYYGGMKVSLLSFRVL